MSALFYRALKQAVADGDVGAQAKAHDGLGMIAFSKGRLQAALSEYQAALQIWPAAGEPAEQALTLCGLGVILLELGLPEEALGIYGKALDLLRLEDRRDVHIEVFDGLGLALHDIGDRERAIWAYKQALEAAREPREEGRFRSRLANVYRDKGDFDLAWEELQKARVLAHKSGDTRWEAFVLADLAHIEDLRHKDQEGLRLFDWAFKLLGPSPELLPKASIRFGRAEVLRDLGRFEEALKAVKQSIDWVEPARADLDDPGMRVNFFSSRQRYYELYITLLMDLHRRNPKGGWLVKAFEASDRSHSRSLLDDVAGEPTAQGWKLAEIQRELLDDKTTLLAYSLGDRGSFLWVVNRDRISAFILPRRHVVEDVAARAWESLSQSREDAEVQNLAQMLLPDGIEPLLRNRLLISPDGYLHQIPFPLLRRPDRPRLIERHILSSLPSASYLVGMRRLLGSRQPASKELALLGDPVFGHDDKRLARLGGEWPQHPREAGEATPTRLDRLIFAEQEARNILALVPPESRLVALGFKASRTAVLDPVLASYRIIHITTHFIGGDHPEFTGLMLSRYNEKGESIEGLVRASEIYGLSLPAELVVLSACGSGLGRRLRGEGPMGMTRAFLHAGAKQVVVSLWDVEDGATTELMTRFYRQMLQGKLRPVEALRAAQLSMAHGPNPKWRSPRVWGAFVLQGEPL